MICVSNLKDTVWIFLVDNFETFSFDSRWFCACHL